MNCAYLNLSLTWIAADNRAAFESVIGHERGKLVKGHVLRIIDLVLAGRLDLERILWPRRSSQLLPLAAKAWPIGYFILG